MHDQLSKNQVQKQMFVEQLQKKLYTREEEIAKSAQSDMAADREYAMMASSLHAVAKAVLGHALTKRQLFMWMGQQLNPDYPIYNMPMAFTISGALNPALFQQAFRSLVQHTDILRTRFKVIDGEPRQIIERDGPSARVDDDRIDTLYQSTDMYCPLIDLSNLADPQAAYQETLTQRKEVPINLSERVFDTALFKLGEAEFIWYIALHHIVIDAWSFSLLYKRISDFYITLAQGDEVSAPDSPAYYRYIAHEEAYRQSPQAARDEAYWTKRLSQSTGAIPFYGNQSPNHSNKVQPIQRVVYDLGQDRSDQLREIANQADVRALTPDLSLLTIFTMLTAAYTTRISNQRCVPISMPFHNRTSQPFKETIGLFMEVCPLYAEIDDDETFISLLKKVRGETYTTMRHSQYSLSNGAYTDSQNHAFDLMVNYHPMSFPDFGGFSTEPAWFHSGYWDGGQSLSLQIHDFGETGHLAVNFDFNRDQFDEETQRRTISHFLKMLDGFIQDRTAQIALVNILSEDEREKILIDFNRPVVGTNLQRLSIEETTLRGAHQPTSDRQATVENLQTFVQQFEDQAAQTPSQIALIYDDQTFTYGELNCRANQLARYLHRLGIGFDTLVGLCLERTPALAIGILGILKAGAAYLPLDPTYPKARLNFILGNAGAPYLLTERVLAGNFIASDEGECQISPAMDVIGIDTDAALIDRESKEDLDRGVSLDHLAYVIYTSGSTGQPKGVMISHKGLANYLTWAKDAYHFSDGQEPNKGAPIHSSIAFDLTVTSLLVPLLTGQSIELIPQGREIEALGNALKQGAKDEMTAPANYNLVKITPAHLDTLKQQVRPEEAPSAAKAFIIGGEALHTEHIAFWLENAPDTVLINEYGPTETVVGCAVYQMTGTRSSAVNHEYVASMQQSTTIPIGRPIANTQLYILDRYLQPVPIGVTGELYIAGLGLARGYLNQPGLTAERFMPNPFSHQPGERLYKTGDLARYLSDGNIEFLGRFDHQVKVRGYRIELGEIEAILSQHPSVKACAISPKVNRAAPTGGDKRLVAYIVPEEGLDVERQETEGLEENAQVLDILTLSNGHTLIADMRRYLNTRLPSYMVPSAFLFVPSLPLTHNGKVDRRALPDPDWCQPELGNHFVSPRTVIEVRLAELWAKILNLKKVGIHHNFFELGGHSLLAMRLLSFIQLEFSVEIPLSALFGTPTIAELAPLIVQKQIDMEMDVTQRQNGSFEKRSSTW